MPGHWLLARLGKRVLRPGGLELTSKMLAGLDITSSDEVVEFAPGLGVTTRMVLEKSPSTFTAVERDDDAAQRVRNLLQKSSQRCVNGSAEDTGLDDQCATVVFGEAMLSMQTSKGKRKIIAEARRLLRPGGRYGIHELGMTPNDLDDATKQTIAKDLSRAIHVGARPLTRDEWVTLFEEEGFRVTTEHIAPMSLLEPARMVADEGLMGAAKILANIVRDKAARQRVLEMRQIFQKHAAHLNAITLVATRIDD
jgi:phospholipid N-methyltransferase